MVTWAEGLLPGSIRLYAIGRTRLMAENYLTVSEMTETRMMIIGRKSAVEVSGEGLRILEIRKGAMVLEGEFSEIVFLQRGEGD